jgi:hypothetical protein
MLIYAPDKVVGYAEIECTTFSARQKIDVISHRTSIVSRFRVWLPAEAIPE